MSLVVLQIFPQHGLSLDRDRVPQVERPGGRASFHHVRVCVTEIRQDIPPELAAHFLFLVGEFARRWWRAIYTAGLVNHYFYRRAFHGISEEGEQGHCWQPLPAAKFYFESESVFAGWVARVLSFAERKLTTSCT